MFIRICAYLKITLTYLYIKYPRPQKINLNSRNQNIYNQIMSRQNLFNCESVYNRLVSEKKSIMEKAVGGQIALSGSLLMLERLKPQKPQ